MQQGIKALIKNKIIQSAHDVSDGGLFITLLESAMPNEFGFTVYTDSEIRKDAFLFGEAQSRVVVSVKPEEEEKLLAMLTDMDIALACIGEVTAGDLLVDEESFGDVKEAKHAHDNALANYLK